MALDTKLNLNECKFEQLTTETLNLSGCTNIFGNLIIKSGGTISILDNHGMGKVFTSDYDGNGTNVPWDSKQKIYWIKNAGISSTNASKRYKNYSIIY